MYVNQNSNEYFLILNIKSYVYPAIHFLTKRLWDFMGGHR